MLLLRPWEGIISLQASSICAGLPAAADLAWNLLRADNVGRALLAEKEL